MKQEQRETPTTSDNFDEQVAYSLDCHKCGKEHTLITQADNEPEYYTGVTVVCDCGEWVEFQLPVN